MRVVECNICGDALAAATDDELLQRLTHHVESEHPDSDFDQGTARDMIANEAYDASDS